MPRLRENRYLPRSFDSDGRPHGIIKFDADLMRPFMLDLANDIRSLSDFKRNTVDLLDRLRKTGHPLVLT
jgi:hypothetical protein